MTYCDFKVGDEVVCVDAEPMAGRCFLGDALKQGQVYTVTGFENEPEFGVFCVTLAEAVNDHMGSAAYRASRFRKVIRTKTDLSLEAFFKVPGGYEEPKRSAPAKKRERA